MKLTFFPKSTLTAINGKELFVIVSTTGNFGITYANYNNVE